MKPNTVCFIVWVRGPNGHDWPEKYWMVPNAEPRKIRGWPEQPQFTGDIDAWGRAIIDWFNGTVPPERHRSFIRAELASDDDMPDPDDRS